MSRFIVILAVFWGGLLNSLAHGQGLIAQSENFTLISDAPVNAEGLLSDLETFQKAVRQDLGLDEDIYFQPLTLTITGDAETFALISPGGNPAGIYRQGALGQDIIIGHSDQLGHWLSNGLDPASLKLVLRHEVVHHILETHYERKLPLWALEGLAEYYATYRKGADGRASYGQRLPGQKLIDEETRWLPVATILKSRSQYPDFPNWSRSSLYRPQQLFYAQSMAIAQFIMEQPEGLSKIHAFTDQQSAGSDIEDVFQAVFGTDFATLETILKEQAKTGTSSDTNFAPAPSLRDPLIIQSEPRDGELLANQLRLVLTYGHVSDRTDRYIASLQDQLTPTEPLKSSDEMLLAQAIYAWRAQDWVLADTLAAMVESTNPDSADAAKMSAKIAYGRLGDHQDDPIMWREAERAVERAMLLQAGDEELHLFRVAVSRPDASILSSRSLRSLDWLMRRQVHLRQPHSSLMMLPALLHEARFEDAQTVLESAELWADTEADRQLVRQWRTNLMQARLSNSR